MTPAATAARLSLAGPAPRSEPIAGAALDGSPAASQPVAVLLLADVAAPSRLWGYSRFVLGRLGLRGLPGLRFCKVLGSGYQGGFGLRPSASHLGLFMVFGNDVAARHCLDESALVQAWRARSREFFSVRLQPFSSRGTWAGTALPASVAAPSGGPVATLTRASIRLSRAASFWRHAPPSQQSLAQARGCLLAAGVGEAPLLRQATFSLWAAPEHIDAYARSGAHAAAARAAYAEGYFSESMFVRFVPHGARGVWQGRHLG